MILVTDFQQQNKRATFYFGEDKPDLSICNEETLKIEPPLLFQIFQMIVSLVVTSRRYSEADRKFIDSEIQQMLKVGNTRAQ